jgi:hypothetical protein
MPRRPSRSPVIWAIAVALVLVVAGVAWLIGVGQQPGDAAAKGPAPVVRTSVGTPTPTPTPSPTTCATAKHDFAPRTIVVPGVTKGASVVHPPRDADGVPGVPPLTNRGKTVFAWDREQGIRPGDPAGNVLLNAHTWPDGSALGNRLLAGLQVGDRIVVRGADDRLCYRVTERVEVAADADMPRYYETAGPPQLAILVCSGRRLGPGKWEKRTVWFASPSV